MSSRAPRNRIQAKSAAIKTEIPDSDEMEVLTFETSNDKGVFSGIIVPPGSAGVRNTRKARKIQSAASNTDSADASGYETEDTSAMTTPVEVEEVKQVKSRPISATERSRQLRQAKDARKRGRTTASDIKDSVNEDSKLAAQLQAAEYDDSNIETVEPSAKRRRVNGRQPFKMKAESVDISSDEDVYVTASKQPATKRKRLSLMEIDDSEDEPLVNKVREVANAGRARMMAVKNIMASHLITPTQTIAAEESELSELDSADEIFESDDSVTSTIADTDDLSIDDDGTVGALTSAFAASIPTSVRERRAQAMESRRDKRAKRERGRLEGQHPQIKTMWKDLEQEPRIVPVQASQPTHINRKLKPFQLEGLDWMIKQEKSRYKGGLLGDEMGMGKTIQACSLIMSDYPAKRPTLVVVPPVALMQWQAEITDYTSGALKVLVYHISANPKCKLLSQKDLEKYNVIMISYSGLESMHRKENKGWTRGNRIVKEDSLIHAIHYHRVILDEAHSIKSRTTGVAKACFALQSDYKWCLSGTPVQNRIGEFFSLLRFLDVKPYACYFCKSCSCAQLHWEQDAQKKCASCSHSGFNHVSVFNQEILNPVTGGASDAIRQAGFDKLRLITDRIMLRRLKKDHTSSMELPPKEVIIHNEFFGEVEHDFSRSIMSNSARKFDTYVSQGVMLNNYANIFGLIMQMRQIADHPDLMLRRHAEGGQNILVCCVCDEPAEEAIRSRCRHEFCRLCAKTYMQSFEGQGDADCPTCHLPLSIDLEQPEIEQDEENVKKNSIINRIKMDNWTSSTKIEMLVYDLYKLRSKKQTHKSIVFSQFTSMLQLVQWRLQKSGFTTVLLDGSMSPTQRQKSISYFMENVDVEVFLVSLKAGGVALNLTEASRVFIIDPWWNPAAEWQSADRCHRIGQRRPCVITRLCIEDSVESRIVLLQEKKANLINGTINNDQVAMEKLTPEDMQFLFRGA